MRPATGQRLPPTIATPPAPAQSEPTAGNAANSAGETPQPAAPPATPAANDKPAELPNAPAANTTIDRGATRDTIIGEGTKIDNLVQIGHNVAIGENCLICGMVGISGSVKIGDRVVLGGGVGIADHVTIGSDAMIAAGSGVGSNVPAKAIMVGFPAVPRERAFEQFRYVGRLRALFAEVGDLKKRIADGVQSMSVGREGMVSTIQFR